MYYFTVHVFKTHYLMPPLTPNPRSTPVYHVDVGKLYLVPYLKFT